MEQGFCNVIYVDRGVRRDKYLNVSQGHAPADVESESEFLAENARLLLEIFGEVHLISSGSACLSQWLELQDTSLIELKPTLILIDTPYEETLPERPRSSSSSPAAHPQPEEEDCGNHEEDLYGLALLQRIVSEAFLRNLSKLVVPIPVIVFPQPPSHGDPPEENLGTAMEVTRRDREADALRDRRSGNRNFARRCLELGATDVMASPMNAKCMSNLEVHTYRAHLDAAREQRAMLEVRRGRKRSWVGISEEKPFAYLREAMVSGLMSRICRIDHGIDDPIGVKISIPLERQSTIATAVGQWHFCAHKLSDDELIVAALIMFRHALSLPELAQWRLPTDRLHSFLIACRAAYNTFVPYHNFRHVVDVLQATFNFLVHIGSLPPYPSSGSAEPTRKRSAATELLGPFEALTLLITAIGHDVGHPGVNNGFLTKLNAPLAQLYNDRSVLESFHCAAYSQILRRHWPAVFESQKMRSLIISSILATDMGLHFEYMKKLESLRDGLRANNSMEGWDSAAIDENRALVCALLIKCADISNVARQHKTAVQWMHILSDEFSRQASMESELSIPSSLMAPPKSDILSLGKAQLGFMNIFVVPLFQGVADILPPMQYCVDELHANKTTFELIVAEEQKRGGEAGPFPTNSNVSPRSATEDADPSQEDMVSPATTGLESPAPTEKGFFSCQVSPLDKQSHRIPEFDMGVKDVNGIFTNPDGVNDFTSSDTYHASIGSYRYNRQEHQRRSETTEGSSVPYTSEWTSAPASATTGRLPLSPSTQGTSIVSRDSIDPSVSAAVTTITAPEPTLTTAPEPTRSQVYAKMDAQRHPGDDLLAAGTATESASPSPVGSCKALKKKPSRFRINALPFFRKHSKGSSPQPAADTAG